MHRNVTLFWVYFPSESQVLFKVVVLGMGSGHTHYDMKMFSCNVVTMQGFCFALGSSVCKVIGFCPVKSSTAAVTTLPLCSRVSAEMGEQCGYSVWLRPPFLKRQLLELNAITLLTGQKANPMNGMADEVILHFSSHDQVNSWGFSIVTGVCCGLPTAHSFQMEKGFNNTYFDMLAWIYSVLHYFCHDNCLIECDQISSSYYSSSSSSSPSL